MLGLPKPALVSVAALLLLPAAGAQVRTSPPQNKVPPRAAAARKLPLVAVTPQRPRPAAPAATKAAFPAASKPGARARRGVQKHPALQPEPQPVVPAPPPPTPEQMPATPPRVTYQGGLLTVVAPNSTLADVLNAIRARTGAGIDLPPSGLSERVVASIGPASPRDVVAALLNGSKFNYIILGTEENPDALQRIILTARSADAPVTAGNPAQQRPAVQVPANADEVEENVTEDDDAPDVPPPQPPPTQVQPQQVQPGAPTVQPGVVRTPEQLLQELQRVQQQRQQQQQQQQPPPGRPVPPPQEQAPEASSQPMEQPQQPAPQQQQSPIPAQQPAVQETPPPSGPPPAA